MSILDSSAEELANVANSSQSEIAQKLIETPRILSNPIQVPVICTLNVAILTTPSGFSVVFYNQTPDQNWNLNAPMHSIPVAMVNMPPAQAKDLMLMLMELVPHHEQQFGEISTPYMLEKGLRETSIKQ